jgi:hypothetical protein
MEQCNQVRSTPSFYLKSQVQILKTDYPDMYFMVFLQYLPSQIVGSELFANILSNLIST